MQQTITRSLEVVQKRIKMLPPLEPQRYRPIFAFVSAVLVVLFITYATRHLHYYPAGWQALLILIAGIVWFLRPQQGVWLTLAIMILPIAYNFPFGGWGLAIAAIVMLIGMRVFNPFSFITFALLTVIFARSFPLPLLFTIPLTLAFLGTTQGPIYAGLAAWWAEILMIIGGRKNVGILSGGIHGAPLIHTLSRPVSVLNDFRWLQLTGDPGTSGAAFLSKLFTPFIDRPLLIGQIVLWAGSAGMVAALMQRPITRKVPTMLQAIGCSALLLAIGQIVLSAILAQGGADIESTVVAALISGALVFLIAPILQIAPPALQLSIGGTAPQTMQTPSSGFASTLSGKKTESPGASKREIPTDTWSDLAGIEDIEHEIQEAIDSQFDPRTREMLQRMAITPTRGVLLFGPLGTGKTKIARVIAHEAKASFFAVSGTEFTSKWYGDSEANLRRIFEEARQNRPAVLFFDELEAFLPRRNEMARSDAPEKGVIATFLAYTDGIAAMDGVLFVAATNYPNLIDPAALRPGRFDKLIYISAPDQSARVKILTRYLDGRKLTEDVDREKLAARMERFTGADIQRLCSEASRRALDRTKAGSDDTMTMADLETALSGMKPTVTIRMLREYESLADQYGRRSERSASVDVIAKPVYHWSDVAGLEPVKRVLREAIEMPLAHPELFIQYRVKPHKGVLLFGPPGCGKTFLAKVVAGEAQAHFLHIRGPELLQRYVGESENQLRELFARARENAPCVLFFDEIDALAAARGSQEAANTQILTQMLTEMDGIEELKGVIVVGATNRPDTLDPALLRPGRFDRLLYIPPPDREARISLIGMELANRPIAEDIDTPQIANLLDGYSAADITAICNKAAFTAATSALHVGEPQQITMASLIKEIQQTARSISPEETVMYEALRDRLQR